MPANASKRASAADRQQFALDGWLSTQSSANTRAAYRCDFEMFGKWCAGQGALPLTADTSTLVAFQAARKAAGDSASTIRRRWSAMSSFYDFAVEQQLRSGNPSLGVDRPKVVSGDPSPTLRLSADAVASYHATAAALDPRLEALVALLVRDGLKVAEALALDIEDVGGRASTITVRRRGGSRRIVLDPHSASAIRRCIGKRSAGPLFVSEKSSRSTSSHRLTRFGADHLIRRLRTNPDLEPVTANALRRFHITSAERAGSTLDEVTDRAGLANKRSAQRYVDRLHDRSAPQAVAEHYEMKPPSQLDTEAPTP